MDITESAQRVGALAFAEQQLFETVGAWVASTDEPDLKLLFARLSRHHGDHALALAAVLPDTRDHDPEALVAPGDDPSGADLAADSGPARLGALGVVLARQIEALERYLADGSPVRDGPGLRVVRLVRDDDAAEAEELAAISRER
jgi:hypothetical protein